MPDIAKAKRNVSKMLSGGASEQEIDTYLKSEGLSAEHLRGEKVPYTSVKENLTAPTRQAVDKVKDRFGKMLQGKDKGPSLGDLAAVPLSVLSAPVNAVSRPVSQALVNSGLPIYDQRLSQLIQQNPFNYKPKQVKGKEAEDMLNTDIGMALSSGMPGRGSVGRSGPQIPQGLKTVKPKTPTEKALRRLIADQNLGTAKAKAAQFEEAGITDFRPIDILDDNARARTMAAAARKTPARAKVNELADQDRLNFGGRVGAQISRNISSTPRNVEDVISELEDVQSQAARTNYAGPYQTPVKVDEPVLNALNSDEGRKAIESALQVARERPGGDPAMTGLNELQRTIASPGLRDGGPYGIAEPRLPEIPASVLDRIQIAMRQRSKNLLKGENANAALAGVVGNRRKAVNSILDSVPGLQDARNVYAGQQRVIDATELAPNALKGGYGPEIDQATAGIDLADLAPARDALAREMQRRLGERISSAPSTAKMFTADEPMSRIASYTGPKSAQKFSDATRLELERLNNINAVAPDKGLKSLAVAEDDLQTAHDLADVSRAGIASMFGGKLHAAFIGMKLWARHMGMNDKEAEILAQLAVDPTKTAQVIKALSGKYGVAKATKLTAAAKAYAAESAASNMNEVNQ